MKSALIKCCRFALYNEIAQVTFLAVLGFVLRFIGIFMRVPYPDEIRIIEIALRFGTGDFNTYLFGYPTGFFYLLFGVYAVYYVIGNLIGCFASPAAFIMAYFTNNFSFYILARFLSVLCGTLSIFVCYSAAKILWGHRKGILAAAFMAVSPVCVYWSQQVTLESALMFFSCLVIYFSAKIMKRGLMVDYALAGLTLGMGVSTKYNGILIMLVLPLAHILGREYRLSVKDFARIVFSKHMILAAICAVIGFVIFTPYSLLDNAKFVDDLKYIASYGSGNFVHVGAYLTNHATQKLQVFFSAFRELGAGVFWLLILSFFWIIYRRQKENMFLLVSLLFGLVIIFQSNMINTYYLTPLYPVAFLIVAGALLDIPANFGMKWKKLRLANGAILYLVVFTVLALNLQNVGKSDRVLLKTDTLVLAKTWIERNIPTGTKLLLDWSYNPALFQSPAKVADTLKKAKTENFNSGQGLAFISKLNPAVWYDLGYLEVAHFGKNIKDGKLIQPIRSLNDYKSEGYNYVVINSNAYQRFLASDDYPSVRKFYESLNYDARLVTMFDNAGRPGPVIKVFDITDLRDKV